MSIAEERGPHRTAQEAYLFREPAGTRRRDCLSIHPIKREVPVYLEGTVLPLHCHNSVEK